MTLNDLEHPKSTLLQKRCLFLSPTAQIWVKIDPYNQQQKCRPMILVSGNIRFMGIFAVDSCLRGHQMRVGLLITAIFGDLSVYFFGIFRDKASNIIWRYANPCQSAIDCKVNDLDWHLPSKCVFGQHSVAAKTRLLEHAAQIRIKV